MKILTWILVVFSGLAILGLLTSSTNDENYFWGLVYAGLVIAQGVMVLNHLKEEKEKELRAMRQDEFNRGIK